MYQSIAQPLIVCILIASTGSALAAASRGASSPIQQPSKSQLGQHEIKQSKERSRDGEKSKDTGTTQGDQEKLRDRDNDLLRDLELELSKDQQSDRDRDRLQEKRGRE